MYNSTRNLHTGRSASVQVVVCKRFLPAKGKHNAVRRVWSGEPLAT